MAAEIHIGTQGWNYDGWIGSFYPPKTSSKETLTLYSRIFDTVEIDSTFYAIPSESTVQGWYNKSPEHFSFSVKLISEITHKNRLWDCEPLLRAFVERIKGLRQKLAVILIQLPPDFSPAEHKAFSRFLKLLPGEVQFAVEFRDPKWISQAVLEEMQTHQVSLALTDGNWVSREISFQAIEYFQSQFAYIRWMGRRELTDFSKIQIDRTKELQQWVEAIHILANKTESIFGYFNNHFQGHSPASGNLLKNLLQLPTVAPTELIIQPSLF